MSHHGLLSSDSRSVQRVETEKGVPAAESPEVTTLSAVRARVTDEAVTAIALDLNGPLTALMLYMNELKRQSHQFAQTPGNRLYLQQVVDNALQQTERVYAMVKRLSEGRMVPEPTNLVAGKGQAIGGRDLASRGMRTSNPEQKPLTRREREVLTLISEGYSNKQGALRMGISPRTFESHRAEAMRKLGAKNTADLVRKALAMQST